jgi:hypothetical protein
MGDPTISWTPRGAGTIQTITLPWLTGYDPQPLREVEDVLPIGSVPYRTDLGGFSEVYLECDGLDPNNTTHAPVIRQLLSFQSHVQAGGRFSFCLDHDKTAGYFTTNTVNHGDTTVSVTDNKFTAWNASGALSNGDPVRLFDYNPEHRAHFGFFDSISGNIITLNEGTNYSFSAGSVLLYEYLHPLLMGSKQYSQGTKMLTPQKQRLYYTFALTAVEYPAAIGALYTSADLVASGNRTTQKGGISLDLTYWEGDFPDLGGGVNLENPVLIRKGIV